MKILVVIQRYHPVIGGSENLAKNFLDYISRIRLNSYFVGFNKTLFYCS